MAAGMTPCGLRGHHGRRGAPGSGQGDPGFDVTAEAPTHRLGEEADAVRQARRFVQRRVADLGGNRVVDDAALVAAELVANAHQHGSPPVDIRVYRTDDVVRIEVYDSGPRSPIRPAPSTSNMTGRGLALVEAFSSAWGVRREDDGGKTVWAELSLAAAPPAPNDDLDVDQLLAAWDDHADEADRRYTVELGDVPTNLLLEAKAHIDNLVREFSLAAAAENESESAVPPHLAALIETVVHGFSDARASIKRQALEASRRGEPRTRLVLNLPLSAADAGEAYLRALDEADAYARAARLLTLETPPDQRLFRRWYVEGVINQLRQVARGESPEPVGSFEDRLLAEVRHVSAAQRVSESAARLQRVTAALAQARTPEDVASVVLSESVNALGASGGGLLVPAADGVHLAVPGAVGYGEEFVGQLREERLDAPLPAATALRSGQPVWLETRQERDTLFPALRGFEASVVAMCAVPLLVGGRPIGALRFSFDKPKLFDDDERAFILALAAQTAATLHRAEIYEAERQAALELQRALLPSAIAAVDGWEVAAHYSPAGRQEAGGDFYDVFCVDDGRAVAIVGDVMGRGLQAAAAMAQVRSVIRAYAIDDPHPTAVLARLDSFFASLGPDQFVTLLFVLLDPATRTVQVGNAGHLPPLLVRPGTVEVLPTVVGLPLGVSADERTAIEWELPSGSALVALTDGLVERRGEDIDAGMERVLATLHNAAGGGARELLREVLAAAPIDGSHDDDVTVLVLRNR